MGLTKQDLHNALTTQTNKLAKKLEDLKKSITNEIQELKNQMDQMKEQIQSTKNDFEKVKNDMDSLTTEIRKEVMARPRIANQIYIGNAKDTESTSDAIQLACDGIIQPKTMEAITIKYSRNKGTTICHITEMENLNDKMMVLKRSKKVTESDDFDNVFLEPSKTKKRTRKREAVNRRSEKAQRRIKR